MAREIRYLKFGTEDYPIPVKRGNKIEWLASESQGVIIPTMREDSQDRIYGDLIRNCVPDTGMLPIFEEMLVRYDPIRTKSKVKSYNYQILGTPGGGKTYIMKQVAKLVHPKGAIVFECKQHPQSPEDIYKVTTFNVDQASKQGALDGKLLMGNVNPEDAISQETVDYLKQMLGEDVVMQETRDNRTITSIDWNSVNKPSDYLDMVLNKVCKMENLEVKENSNGMGFKVKNGPLLNALLNPDHPDYGRVLLLDESNRMPELYDVISFFSDANVDKITLKGEDDTEFTIHRSSLPPTFMLYETGNDAMAGMGDDINIMSKPNLSRKASGIDIETIPVPDSKDYIARTAKHMTGVPAMQIYLSQQEYFDAHPEELVDTLMYMRTVGLTKDEINAIPRSEILNIQNFSQVKDVCASYGDLMYQADKLINEQISKGEESALPSKYLEYLETKALVDLRFVFKLLQHSEILRPQTTSKVSNIFKKLGKTGNRNKDVDLHEEACGENSYMALLHRGTQLENEVGTKLQNIFMPRNLSILVDGDDSRAGMQAVTDLWSNLKAYAKHNNFEFAGYKGNDSVAKRYNLTMEQLPEIEVRKVRKVLIDSIKEEYAADLDGATIGNPEALLSDDCILSTLDMIKKNADEKNVIIVPNYDIESISENPLKKVLLVDRGKADIQARDLINTNQFADSFIISKTCSKNLRQFWRDSLQVDKESSTFSVMGKTIADGGADIAVTSVLVNNDGNVGTAHIIHNKRRKSAGHTVILSDFDVSEKDSDSLKDAGVLLINVANNLTEDKITFIEKVIERITPDGISEGDIVSAVMVRVAPDMADGNQSIRDLCRYLGNMSEARELPQHASQITNITYRNDMTVEQILTAKNIKLRGER